MKLCRWTLGEEAAPQLSPPALKVMLPRGGAADRAWTPPASQGERAFTHCVPKSGHSTSVRHGRRAFENCGLLQHKYFLRFQVWLLGGSSVQGTPKKLGVWGSTLLPEAS